ncbi:MAG TPA: helix-turn-helix domain-containing protein [Solirubrobacteraceae bacterium]|nr:helix-turn-helix domain-containing protein [Solirubrobacteraceae bacterium]
MRTLDRGSESDVLAQPTRAHLFGRLARLGRLASTDELSEELGLHRSGVRAHLERLRAAGLVSRERLPQPRGRPRYGWQIAPNALPRGEPPDAYRTLARWLARSVPPRPARLREVERTGREVGREISPPHEKSEAVQAMGRTLTALGFAPQSELKSNGHVVLTLGSCPYRGAVHDNQPVVCGLHRGLTQGLLDVLEPAARLANFVPKDPDRAGCLIEVEGLAPRKAVR